MKKFIFFGIVVFLLALLIYIYQISFLKQASHTKATPSPTISISQTNTPSKVIASRLEVPWAIVFLPDKRILFTERPGRIRIIDQNGNLQKDPVGQISVYSAKDTEGGLLGMALHPSFSSNHYIYLYYTYTASGNNTLNRVVRMTFENNKLTNLQTIVDKIPGALYHNGGRIKFGPDGFLYITTGDSESPSLAQDKNSLAGKILRVNDKGDAAPGNPFDTLIYSYGHRNPQGLAWDSSGRLWSTEHGKSNPGGFDEINIIIKGDNYGWPTIQGSQTKDGMQSPFTQSGAETWAPAGAIFYNGSLFYGGLKGEALFELKVQNKNAIITKHLLNQYGRIRDVELGPDNLLYVTTSNQDGRGNPMDQDDRIIAVDPAQL